MQHLIAINMKRKRPISANGFTLIELLVATLLIGIMAAIAGPGMLGFLSRSKVTTAQGELQGLLQEIQRSAIKKSRACNITLPATASSGDLVIASTASATTPAESCIIIQDRTLDGIQIRHNFATVVNAANTDNNLFDFRGNTSDFIDDNLVIVISKEEDEIFQKCIVVSSGLGMIRTGNYPDNDTTVDITKCTPSE